MTCLITSPTSEEPNFLEVIIACNVQAIGAIVDKNVNSLTHNVDAIVYGEKNEDVVSKLQEVLRDKAIVKAGATEKGYVIHPKAWNGLESSKQ